MTAYFTWRTIVTADDSLTLTRKTAEDSARFATENLSVAQKGQITDRFTKAVDQLGASEDNSLPTCPDASARSMLWRVSRRTRPSIIGLLWAS